MVWSQPETPHCPLAAPPPSPSRPQDIKPENIMFDSEGANGVLKVLDFGSSAFVQPNETVRRARGGLGHGDVGMWGSRGGV